MFCVNVFLQHSTYFKRIHTLLQSFFLSSVHVVVGDGMSISGQLDDVVVHQVE